MSKIYIASKPVVIGVDTSYDHLYLVYDPDDDPTNGNEFIIRGGPENVAPDDPTSDTWVLGEILIENGIGIEDSADGLNGDNPYTDRYYTEYNLEGLQADNVWAVMQAHADAIADANIPYELYFDPDNNLEIVGGQNSNSVIASIIVNALKQGSMYLNMPNGPEDGDYPGLENDLPMIVPPEDGYDWGGYRYKLGTEGFDTITALDGAVNYVLDGGDDHDVLQGNAGDDKIYGGAGSDILTGSLGGDILIGGAGSDTALFSDLQNMSVTVSRNEVSGYDFWVTASNGDLDALTGIEIIVGTTSANDRIDYAGFSGVTVSVAGSVLTDSLGYEWQDFEGASNGDTVDYAGVSDVRVSVTGSSFTDSLGYTWQGFNGASAGSDVHDTLDYSDITGSGVSVNATSTGLTDGFGHIWAGFENIIGTSAGDVLHGDGANNTIKGGLGADTLGSGTGADVFAGSVSELSGDTITDLSRYDRILVEGVSFIALNPLISFMNSSYRVRLTETPAANDNMGSMYHARAA